MDHRSLLLLGLLMSQSQHGYQIHDFIEKNLPFLSDMKKPTAYALLDKLSKEQYINVSVEKEGSRPPRKVYSINDKGEHFFYQLLSENLSAADTLFYEGDIGLLFLDHLPSAKALAFLQKRRKELEEKQRIITQVPLHNQRSGVNIAFRHKRKMLEAELSFLNEILLTWNSGTSATKEVE